MSKDKNLNKDINLKNYKGSDSVSLKEMNFGLWLSENRKRMLKALTIFLLALCAFFLVYSTYNYIIYFWSEDPLANLGASPTSPRQLTVPFEVGVPQIFSSGELSDLAVKITSANEKFAATFHYCFTLAGAEFACGDDFILPQGEKYVLALGQNLTGSRSEVSFKIIDIFWQRIDAHQIPNWPDFLATRLNFPISDLTFLSGRSSSTGQNSLSFQATNATAYSYYEVPLTLLFFNGEELAGVNRYILKNFLTGDSRSVRLSWSGNLSDTSRTEVSPDLNIMAAGVYRKYQGGN